MKKILIPLIALLIAIITALFIYNSPDHRISRSINLAKSLFNEGQWEEAKVELNKIIEIDATNLDAHIMLADVYKNLNDTENQITVYEKIIEIAPDREETYLDYAEIYIAKEDWQKAREILQLGVDNTGEQKIKVKLAEVEKKIAEIEEAERKVQEEAERIAQEEAEIEAQWIQAKAFEDDLDWWLENIYKINGVNWDGITPLSSMPNILGLTPEGYDLIGNYLYICNNDSIDVDYHKGEYYPGIIYEHIGWENNRDDKLIIKYAYAYINKEAQFNLYKYLSSNNINSVMDILNRWGIEDISSDYILNSKKYGKICIRNNETAISDYRPYEIEIRYQNVLIEMFEDTLDEEPLIGIYYEQEK